MTKEFLQALSKTYTNMDYYDFLNKTGLRDCQNSLNKFQQFKRAAENLLRFDAQTLENIISNNGTSRNPALETVA
ncbi:hypothetical protein [Cylindrospermum sp. FACHB-282]|uniref:hypothetical protein n=1 Tax=Cylindrospermum sp. FACHB-282 TaxID=2692794 RepID=UPI0016831A35|nr:hypothetical protein [Cylindrospermum sp. FACHB-282]MBD2386003.1 hypothetical protein [Cylindrospermum sp. FACHB-282]